MTRIHFGKLGKALLAPLNGQLECPAKWRPIVLALLRVRAPVLFAACWTDRYGLAKNLVFALIIWSLDWKVEPQTPFANYPIGTPEPTRKEEAERDIKVYIWLEIIFLNSFIYFF